MRPFSHFLVRAFASEGIDELLAHIKPGNWEDYGISDVKVIGYGHIAIATGLWTGKGQVGDHKVDIHERWTDTWVRMPGGIWQCVASQQTEITEIKE